MGGWAERFFCTTSRREQNVCTASRRDAQKNTPDRRYYSCFASERSPEEHPRSQILFVFCIGTTSTRTPKIAATICVLHQKGHQRTTPDRSYYSCFASERTAEEHPRSQILFVFCIGKTSKMTPKEHLPGGSQKWSPSHPENFIRFLLFLLVRRAQKVLQEGFLHFRSKKMARRRGESKMCARRRGENVAPPPLRGWGEEQGTPGLGAGAGYNVNF